MIAGVLAVALCVVSGLALTWLGRAWTAEAALKSVREELEVERARLESISFAAAKAGKVLVHVYRAALARVAEDEALAQSTGKAADGTLKN